MNILKRTPETSIRCLRDSPLSQCFYYLTSAEALVVSSILSTPLASYPLPPPRGISYFFVQIRVGLPTNRGLLFIAVWLGYGCVRYVYLLYANPTVSQDTYNHRCDRNHSINDPSFDHRVSNRINRCREIDRCTVTLYVCIYIYIWKQLCSSNKRREIHPRCILSTRIDKTPSFYHPISFITFRRSNGGLKGPIIPITFPSTQPLPFVSPLPNFATPVTPLPL